MFKEGGPGLRSTSIFRRTGCAEPGQKVFWTIAVSAFKHGVGVAFFGKRAAEIQHSSYVFSKEFETFGKDLENVFHSLSYLYILRKSFSLVFLSVMLSTFEGE